MLFSFPLYAELPLSFLPLKGVFVDYFVVGSVHVLIGVVLGNLRSTMFGKLHVEGDNTAPLGRWNQLLRLELGLGAQEVHVRRCRLRSGDVMMERGFRPVKFSVEADLSRKRRFG